MMPGMLATALRTPFAPGVPPSRRARWGAVAIDILVGAGLAAGALAGGTAWLLVRTEAGTRDVPSGDAAFAFALLLLWRMNEGLADYREYEEVTTILKVPIWIVFVPALVSLALLALASLVSIRDAVAGARRG